MRDYSDENVNDTQELKVRAPSPAGAELSSVKPSNISPNNTRKKLVVYLLVFLRAG